MAVVVLLLLIPSFGTLAKTAKTVTSQTKYIDKYYQVDQNGKTQVNIYLGDEKIASLDSGGNFSFPIVDHLGSPTIITDTKGQIVATNDYRAFGSLPTSTSMAGSNRYKYTGKELDAENNLEYFGQRYYDAILGRFTSIDPMLLKNPSKFLADVQSLNSYAYAKNNPITFFDPVGLLTKIYLEKNKDKGWFEPRYDHAFMAINGKVYNWESNVGREYHQQDGRWLGEDMDVVNWTNFMNRADNAKAEYDIYTLDTSRKQEEGMQRYWLNLAWANMADQGDLRTIYNKFLQSTDAVVEALRRGGVVNQNFKVGRQTANPEKLGYELWFKYNLDKENNQAKNKYYNNIRPNKFFAPVVDLATYKYQP